MVFDDMSTCGGLFIVFKEEKLLFWNLTFQLCKCESLFSKSSCKFTPLRKRLQTTNQRSISCLKRVCGLNAVLSLTAMLQPLGCNELSFPDREGPTSGHGGVVGQELANRPASSTRKVWTPEWSSIIDSFQRTPLDSFGPRAFKSLYKTDLCVNKRV